MICKTEKGLTSQCECPFVFGVTQKLPAKTKRTRKTWPQRRAG